MSLTPEEVQFFRHNGFVRLPASLERSDLLRLREAVLRDLRAAVEPVVRDRHGRTVRISNLWGRGGVFQETLAAPLILDPLEALLGPNIELILNRHNHACLRLADDGTAYMHRDVLQWTRTIVTVIVYLEDTTLENGCTRVVPGSHLLPGVPGTRVEEVEWVRRSRLLEQAVPLPMPAGSLLAMDSMLFHGAGPNHTDESRTSLTIGYHSMDELAGREDPKRVLVRGQRSYGGNDY
jgi:phytanoyl-CoA hydroxylase